MDGEQIKPSATEPQLTTTRSKKSLEQPKHHARKDRLTALLRRAKIIQGAIDGKNLTKIAISTGLAPASAAQQASQILKEPSTQMTFISCMEQAGLTDNFLAAKVQNLINAKQIQYFQKDGMVTDEREVEALETQRKTLELATKLKGHLKDQSQVDINIGIMAMVVSAVKQGDGENGQ